VEQERHRQMHKAVFAVGALARTVMGELTAVPLAGLMAGRKAAQGAEVEPPFVKVQLCTWDLCTVKLKFFFLSVRYLSNTKTICNGTAKIQ